MKRNLLAIAIPALLVAGAANAVEIVNKDGDKLDLYGRVYASDYIKGDTSSEGNSSARLGLKGESKVSNGISAYGRFEWETDTFDSNADIDNRYAYAGLNFGDIGSLDYGKNDGVLKAITAYTDVLPEFGGDSTGYTVLGNRTAAVLTYSNNNFFGLVDGLDFAIQYADKASNKLSGKISSDISLSETREAYGLNAQYAILDSGLTVGAGYTKTAKGAYDYAQSSYIAGINYDANNIYLAGIYLNTDNLNSSKDVKLQGYEAVAAYGIDLEVGRLTPSVAYIQHKIKDADSAVTKYVDVGVQYDLNSHVTALVDYKINLLKESEVGKSLASDQVALGLIYNF